MGILLTECILSNTFIMSKKDYERYKELARTLVHERILYFKEFYKINFETDFLFNRVAIKNSKTRWGSCSSKKNLNFNYNIIHLRPEVVDYLVVHELCHLIQMNHGPNFWNLVEKAIPDYKNLRRILRAVRL